MPRLIGREAHEQHVFPGGLLPEVTVVSVAAATLYGGGGFYDKNAVHPRPMLEYC